MSLADERMVRLTYDERRWLLRTLNWIAERYDDPEARSLSAKLADTAMSDHEAQIEAGAKALRLTGISGAARERAEVVLRAAGVIE